MNLSSDYICGMQFLFISGAEIFFILFIVVMVFGADKIPGIARGLGKGMRQLKDATDDIKREIQKTADVDTVHFAGFHVEGQGHVATVIVRRCGLP